MNTFTLLMYACAILVPVATVLSFAIPYFRKNHLPAKVACSVLFVLTAVFASLSYGSFSSYSILMTSALFLGLLGDFFLDWKEGKTFPVGVVFFTLCHLVYIGNFILNRTPPFGNYIKYFVAIFLGLCVISAVHIAVNKIKFIGKNKFLIPYSITLMISFTVAVTRGIAEYLSGNKSCGICLIAAGTLFVVSDGCLAALMFGKPLLRHTDVLVACTYFPAQTLFALSINFQ